MIGMSTHQHALRGRVVVRVVDRRGRTVARVVRSNAVVNTGRTLIGKLLVGDPSVVPVSHLAVGTNATAPTAADTKLGAEIASIQRAAIQVQPLASGLGLRVSAQVASATNQTVSEAGLFNANAHGAGVMYNRVAFPGPVPIGADLDLVFEWDITF
jgi:hypothetical protein